MNKVQQKFIIDALDQEYKLTEWEVQYINDIADRGDDYVLSEKQNEILNRIQGKLD